ncbi:MAG: oligoendopeptidase F [Bacilli bacterium]|nr:oligoendopeptidase F [Bacilli bacterium]
MAILEKTRNEINELDKWDLTVLYENDEKWNKELKDVNETLKDILKFKDNLTSNSEVLYDAINTYFTISRKLEKLYMYAHLNYDSETSNSKFETNLRKIENSYKNLGIYSSYMEPTLLKEDYELIKKYMEENPKLKEYKNFFEDIFRYKKHILSLKEEELLSNFANVLGISDEIYGKLTETDLKLGFIKDENDEEVELTDSNYSIYISSKNRRVRQDAFKNLYNAYKGIIHTTATTYKGKVEYDCVDAKVRGYKSALEASLYKDNINVSVYENLIKTVSNNLNPLYKYYDLKKEVLKLDELHLYDIYVDLIDEVNSKYTFDEAKDLVVKALSVLGEDYINDLNKAFTERWIDKYSNKCKRSGAYSSGGYDTYPYVLLNFQGQLDDVSTLAHELGHSMHSYYSKNNNSYQDADYAIFVAEVASTVNELLLCKYILNNSNDKKIKLDVLDRMMELFKGTIYRQTMFAEFEKITHEMVEREEVLTNENLEEVYYGLNKKYFGPNVSIDEEIGNEWSRIPHFYYNFYVYKYATGLSAACYIVDGILNGKENALSNYKKFLSLGGSMDPLDELKVAGVDMNDPKVIESALKMFDETIELFKEIYNK